MLLYGFGGLKGSGKDSASDVLVELFGAVKIGMSDPLNTVMMTLNPFVPDITPPTGSWSPGGPITPYSNYVNKHGYTEAKNNPEVRRLLQVMGTEVGRNMISTDVWVDMMERSLSHGPEVACVTGIRFPNEADLIVRLGGTLVWVERPGLEKGDAHASENSLAMEDFDVVIENDSTLGHLRAEVIRMHDEMVEIEKSAAIES